MQETTTNSYLTCAQNSCKALKRVLMCVIQTMTAFNGLLRAVQSPNVSRSSSWCNEALQKQRKDFWCNFTYLQGAWKRGKKDVLNDIMELWQNYFNLSWGGQECLNQIMETSIQQLLRHFIKKQKWHAVGGATGNASRLPNPVVTMDFVQYNFMTIHPTVWTKVVDRMPLIATLTVELHWCVVLYCIVHTVYWAWAIQFMDLSIVLISLLCSYIDFVSNIISYLFSVGNKIIFQRLLSRCENFKVVYRYWYALIQLTQ